LLTRTAASVRLRGGREIDPLMEDSFVRMIEHRHQVVRDPVLDDEERERLGRFLKITANATAYGVLARFDRRERAARGLVDVYGPDDEPTETTSETPEDPGPFCFRPSPSGNPEIVAAIDASDEQDIERLDGCEEVLQDWSEHGLRLYLDPTTADPDRPRRDSKGRRLWVAEAWRWILKDAQGHTPQLPTWTNAYALTRFTGSAPGLSAGSPATTPPNPKQTGSAPEASDSRPPDPARHPRQRAPRRPLPNRPRTLATLAWYDRRTGKPVRVVTLS
jgi:hypothetical protein